ncbi:MAG TPA: hypothetical protein VIC05_07760 [Solirubrobacteraceae bacterium]|jgi:hypothetical protein
MGSLAAGDKRRRTLTLLLLPALLGLMVGGCGGASGTSPSTPGLALERSDLVSVVHALERAQGSVQLEAQAARVAWPLISKGLPATISPSLRAQLARASVAASGIRAPSFMTQLEQPTLTRRVYLTGPAAGIAGLFQSFSNLTEQGWTLMTAAAERLNGSSPAANTYLRAASKLYISCVYDGHFDLAAIGKNLQHDYLTLGGPQVFGGSLPQAEVTSLTSFYSTQLRLEPHSILPLG